MLQKQLSRHRLDHIIGPHTHPDNAQHAEPYLWTDSEHFVRADLGGHLKYSQRWSGVRAGVLLGAQGAVRRGESRGGL